MPYVVLVFFGEKMLYTVAWLTWLADNGGSLSSVFTQSALTAVALASYGAADFAFGLFFLWAAIGAFRNREAVVGRS